MSASKAATPGADRFRPMGQLLWLIAAVRLVAAYIAPRHDDPMASDQLLASTILLIAHGLLYHFGARFRATQHLIAYIGIQFTFAASIGLYSMSLGLSLILFAALGAQIVSFVVPAVTRRGRKRRRGSSGDDPTK
jgi:hypothetical protein